MTSGRTNVRRDQQERVAVITPLGDVDLDHLADITVAFVQVLSDTATDATLIDLSEVTFADSTFLNQLITTFSDHTATSRPLVFAGPLHSAVRRLLEVTGTDAVLPLAATVHTGLEQLRAAAAPTVMRRKPTPGV
ncbi:STAS domain-containing protein [Streptomyces sp. NPDC057302]|uniref:STAS domain-containing protein n=1 Tax=Streptomyces sp. NPDC057302 TaxID=3346094 RepID=UPI003642F8CD